MDNQKQSGGLLRIWNAWLYSLAGIRSAWKNEAAFRQETVLCLILVPSAFWYGSTAVERILLIGSCLIVLIVELLNSAVETTIDRIGEDRHRLSARAKDMGSAAVLISLLLAIITWGLIGFDRFLAAARL